MASYADGPVADEAFFAGPLATHVAKVPAVMGHDYVRYELLICGVGFGERPWHKAQDVLGEKPAKITINIKFEPIEQSFGGKDFALKNQYLFIWWHRVTPC